MNREFFGKTINRIKNWSHQNLANFVSAIKILIAFWLAFTVYSNPEQLKQILALWIAGGTADYFDGKIAKRFNIESQIGSIIDRIGDRALIYPSLFALAWQYRWQIATLPFPSITIPLTKGAIIAMFIIEGLLLTAFVIGVIWRLLGKKINLLPNQWGRKKVGCGLIMGLIWLASITVEKEYGFPLIKLTIFLIYLGFLLMIYWGSISLADYCIRGEPEKDEPEKQN